MSVRTSRSREGLGPRRILRLVACVGVVLAGAVGIGACGGGTSNSSSPSSAGRADSDGPPGSTPVTFVNPPPGEPAEFLGLKVTVSTMTQGGDGSGSWLTVHVRAENASGQPRANPHLGIVCASSEETGGWQEASTFKVGQALPAGAFDEGDVNLLLPGDSRTGQAVPVCTTPAVVRALTTGVVSGNGGPAGSYWSIADDLVAGLNAARNQ